MRISHEVPLCLLKESRKFNDYDYALVHLFDSYPEYYSFYEESIKEGRHVILDNSIFELEEAFDSTSYANWIERLKPTEYIIPDVLEDSDRTIYNCENFLRNYGHLPGTTIGVVQGKTWKELVDCYTYMSERVDKIAISFDYSYYLQGHANFMEGRRAFLERLLVEGIINTAQPHHLLGTYLPQEFISYRSYKWIDTIDTSNPIVHGIKGIRYTSTGLDKKEKIKLAELINIERDRIDLDLVYANIKLFRSFCE